MCSSNQGPRKRGDLYCLILLIAPDGTCFPSPHEPHLRLFPCSPSAVPCTRHGPIDKIILLPSLCYSYLAAIPSHKAPTLHQTFLDCTVNKGRETRRANEGAYPLLLPPSAVEPTSAQKLKISFHTCCGEREKITAGAIVPASQPVEAPAECASTRTREWADVVVQGALFRHLPDLHRCLCTSGIRCRRTSLRTWLLIIFGFLLLWIFRVAAHYSSSISLPLGVDSSARLDTMGSSACAPYLVLESFLSGYR